MGRYTKKDAIRIVSACAKQYKEHLVNRSLLFICMDKHGKATAIEFTFDTSNFLHLTGLKLVNRKWHGSGDGASISASDFYEKCLNHKLREDDFYFAKDGTTELKLDVLPSLLTKNLAAKMIGDFHSDKPKLLTEKLAGGQTACMGFVRNSTSDRFVPNTVIKDDLRKHTLKPLRVIACYRKKRGDAQYDEITYLAKGIDWEAVAYPTEYNYLKKLLLATHSYSLARELIRRSSNVILLDEFDKVSPAFYNAFYQMFDEGTFVDANYSVDVSKCIIICTTNYRTEEEAEKYLGTPIYSRFSKVVIFNPIGVDDKIRIARKCYAGLMEQVDPEDKKLIENNSVLSLFEKVIKDGAYPNMRMLRNDIEDAINYEILKARGIIQ